MKKNLKVIQFLRFLLSNGALVSFFRNRMLNQAYYNKDKSLLKAMLFVRKHVEHGSFVFYGAFVFQDSKEGHYYWNKLSEKWEAINNQQSTRWESLKNYFRK